MFEEINNGVPQAFWDRQLSPLGQFPHGGTAEQLSPALRSECIAYAHQKHPEEALSALVRGRDGVLRHYPMENVHPAPIEHFRACPQAMLALLQDGHLEGVHHSHVACRMRTGEGLSPSHHDMATQLDWGVPFYITCLSDRNTFMDFFGWGDQLTPPPLKERPFRSGVTDCYALVRHAHHAFFGVVLPDGPRADNWWGDKETQSNPIMDNVFNKGFVFVPYEEVQPGDSLLFAIRGELVVHCGVYIGHDLFLHHLHGRVSKVDPLPQWRRFLRKAVRYAPGAESEERR